MAKRTPGKRSASGQTSQEHKRDYWRREFDALHAKMQCQKARQAVDALFSATDAALNRSDNNS